MSNLSRQLVQAGRSLLRNRRYSFVAIVTFAVGVGFTATVFSVVDAVLLRPLPYDRADRIIRVASTRPDGSEAWTSTLDFLDWSEQNTVFETMAASQQGLTTLTDGGDPVPLRVGRVTARYFDVFGVRPMLGRTFTSGDDTPGNEKVVVLSHALWVSQFGSDAAVVGRRILLDGAPYTVIGVLPGDSAFDRGAAQVWYPLALRSTSMNRDYRWLSGTFGVLKAGISLERARAELGSIAARLANDYPDSNKGWGVGMEQYADSIAGPQLRNSLLVLMAAVGGLMLICCCNLASLSLARVISRRSELALRASLGATRPKLVTLYFAEALVLAAAGGGLGIAAAFGAIRWLNRLIPSGVLPGEAAVHLDGRVLAFALVISLVAAAFIGLLPAVRAGGGDLSSLLGEGGRGAISGAARQRLLNLLVVGETALAALLLCFSALFIRSFVELTRVDTGFVTENVITANLPVPGFPPGSNYSSPDEFRAYLAALQTAVGEIPGVNSSAITTALPLTDCCLYQFLMQIEGRAVEDRASRGGGLFKIVTPSYFETLGLMLKQGRFLDDSDTRSGRPAIVVNERLAERYFPGENPIGRRVLNPAIVPGKTERGPDVPWEIVGVVANEKISALNDESSAVAYATYEQSPAYFANLIVRGSIGAASLEEAVRAAIYSVNKDQGILNVRTLDQLKSTSATTSRFQTVLLTVFSGMALLLAATGIYGVLAYTVAQRSHEIGVRTALGATQSGILQLVLKHGMGLSLLGLGIGIGGALVSTPAVRTLLFRVDVRDPYLFGGAAAVLLLVACCACTIPAWRAARSDPMIVLRSQ